MISLHFIVIIFCMYLQIMYYKCYIKDKSEHPSQCSAVLPVSGREDRQYCTVAVSVFHFTYKPQAHRVRHEACTVVAFHGNNHPSFLLQSISISNNTSSKISKPSMY